MGTKRKRRRTKNWAQRNTALLSIGLVGIVTAGLVGAALNRSEPSSTYTRPQSTPAATVEAPTTAQLAPVPAGSRVLFLGDSYTEGYGATDPTTQGFAPVAANTLGWVADVDGSGGTGYLNPGPANVGTYGERAARINVEAPALIVLQGSSNDLDADLTALPTAVDGVIATLKAKYPDAQLVILGPAFGYAAPVNDAMKAYATERNIPYIDAIAGGWLAGDLFTQYTSTETGGHPTTDGYAWIAKNFAASITNLTD